MIFTSHREQHLQDSHGTLQTAESRGPDAQWILSDAGDGEYFITNGVRKDELIGKGQELSLESNKTRTQRFRWRISAAGQGRVFIRANDGNFLQDHNGNTELTPNADEWEKWTISSVKDGNHACRFNSLHLFCFTVMRSWGQELALVRKQQEMGAGIFACEESLVLSDSEMELAGSQRSVVISHSLLSHKKGMFKNSDLFLDVWHRIKVDGRYKSADWTIKVDPDTVFIPDRLRARLGGKVHSRNYPTFFANCAAKVDVQATEHPHFMYGPLEIFSHAAMETFFNGTDMCKEKVALGKSMWEERYMTHCLELLGAKINPHLSLKLLSDPHCDNTHIAPDCSGKAAAFHNFSSVEAYMECWTTARSTEVSDSKANQMNDKK